MLINCFLLALSVSIDSLGIGITYGTRNTLISKTGKIILIVTSLVITNISIFFGEAIKCFLSEITASFIGIAILISMGIYIICNAIKNPINTYDFDNSHSIDEKESLLLGICLSLDAFCIGLGGSIIGIGFGLFPLLVASFQIIFLTLGTVLGKKINKLTKLPNNIWSIISGFILIGIGLSKVFIF